MRARVQTSSAGFFRQPGFELSLRQIGLGLDVETREDEGGLVTEPGQRVQGDLVLRRRSLARDAADQHPVRAFLGEHCVVDAGRHVRACIASTGDLVQQLRRHRADAHLAVRSGVLGDDRGSVRVDLGDREARPAQIGNLCEERRMLPPVAWVPHSMTWPAATAPAS